MSAVDCPKKHIYSSSKDDAVVRVEKPYSRVLDAPALSRKLTGYSRLVLFDGLPKVMRGGWGEVLVDEKDEKQAEECIKEFLEQSAAIEPDNEPKEKEQE